MEEKHTLDRPTMIYTSRQMYARPPKTASRGGPLKRVLQEASLVAALMLFVVVLLSVAAVAVKIALTVLARLT